MTAQPHDDQKPDQFGRYWMHCEDGLDMTKASMLRFMTFVLKNRVPIGDVYAFNPRYPRSAVIASVALRPDQFDAFEKETKGILRAPARVQVNTTEF